MRMMNRKREVLKSIFNHILMRIRLILLLLLIQSFSHLSWGWAQTPLDWQELLKRELLRVYPQTEIELSPSVKWVRGGNVQRIRALHFLGDDSKGNAHFKVEGMDSSDVHEGWIPYFAWQEGRIALQKIKPGDLLRDSYFVRQKFNVAQGLGRELRPLVLSPQTPLENLEAVRTILQGQPLLSSAVDQIPDIRRGDTVKILIKSGALLLSTQGLAQEPGFLSKKLRVTTSSGKKELLGVLHPKNQVEVEL